MNAQEYYSYILKVQEKVKQVLRLQLKLEERIQSFMLVLRNLEEPNKIIKNLESLQNLYKRKLKIIEICERGLQDARIIFEQFENEVKRSQSFATRLKSKVPILAKKDDYEAQLGIIESSAFSESKWQIDYASNNSTQLKEITHQQYELINRLIEQIQSAFDIDEYNKFFENFLYLREKEKALLEGIKKTNSPERFNKVFSKIKEFLDIINSAAEKNAVTRVLMNALKKHPRLATIQAIWAPMPDFSMGSPFIAYYFGVIYLPPFLAICYVLEWSPSLIALAIETTKEARKKI